MPNSLCELLMLAKDDKTQDGDKIMKAWVEYIAKEDVPMAEETRQNYFNLLYANYQNGMYAVGYNPNEKKKRGRKK